MRRFLTILLTTLALTAVLCVSASASNFDDAAEELSKIGMLRGSSGGFNLDQAPTRAQAAIMLVRLHGAEDAAQRTFKSGRITCPFTDVNETTAPYVAWLADEGIASGTSETTFGAAEPCTARAYTIFLLRALGYQDNEDFTPGTAQDFAAGLGIVDTSLGGTFLRDDLVALTYQALGTTLKDGSTYLLDSLIQNEAVDPNAAYSLVEKIENYRAINAASEPLNEGMSVNLNAALAATVSTTQAGETQPSGMVEQNKITVKGSIKVVPNRNPQMSMDLTMDVDGESENVKAWLRSGWLYIQSGETSMKTEMPDEYLEMLESSSKNDSGMSMLPFVESVTKKTSGSEEVYTVIFNDTLNNMLNAIVGQVLAVSGVPADSAGLDLEGVTATYTVSAGTLKSAGVDAAMSVDAGVDPDTQAKTTIGIVMTMEMNVASSGSAVRINFPDFSGFEEVIGGGDVPTGIFGGMAA